MVLPGVGPFVVNAGWTAVNRDVTSVGEVTSDELVEVICGLGVLGVMDGSLYKAETEMFKSLWQSSFPKRNENLMIKITFYFF